MTTNETNDLLVTDFNYDLPPELIAQTPLLERDASRLLVLEKQSGLVHHTSIHDLPDWLRPGDLLVANNSRVLPARLHARKSGSGGRVEVLLLGQVSDGVWTALARPVRKLRIGTSLLIEPRPGSGVDASRAEVCDIKGDGEIVIRFLDGADRHLDDFGEVPLPPYIHETLGDPDRYQTVYATITGSAAAPTAGLHITPALIERLVQNGVGWAEVTLHIGLDTFRPVTVERVADHHIHTEWCEVSDDVAARIAATKRGGGRVVAVGTTAARTLETLGGRWDWDLEQPKGFSGPTGLFIVPGYTWRIVDALLTNFHLPKSTLLMMVSALAGRDHILAAYEAAILERYRFFSFGDAMLII
ncbi:MAG TPA: tRNA preQ1(34) S-adenosylmethionine ribosyltransferase-isomerase QueA [Thermomicrobiales bacterium]|nr:tRNA preQ1(34) S-adenosylmethionine ribosyltransferase-isomerase QueA [Thermomicrobiales bacterium]